VIEILASCDNPKCTLPPARCDTTDWPSSFLVIELVTPFGTRHLAKKRLGFCGTRCIAEWAKDGTP
jgi:hypothetical protein